MDVKCWVVERKLHINLLRKVMCPDQMAEVSIRWRSVWRRLQKMKTLFHKGGPSDEIRSMKSHRSVGCQEIACQPCTATLYACWIRGCPSTALATWSGTWVRTPGIRHDYSTALLHFLAESNIDGHNSRRVDQLIKLQLLKMFWWPIPDHSYIE